MAYHRILLVVMAIVFPLIESTQTCHWLKSIGNGGGRCPFRVRCVDTIHKLAIDENCQSSPNDPINIVLILDKANDKLSRALNDDDIDFLGSVSVFKINTEYTSPNLDILIYMNRLNHLDLSNNHIMQINGTPFYYLYNLEKLYISHNRLENVTKLFRFESNKLKELSLAHNNIRELSESTFEELSSLKELDLSYNFISNLEQKPFQHLPSLEILRLNNNNIKDLNGAVNKLMSLKELYLKGNEIQNISIESIKIIYVLEIFDISDNKLDNLGPIMFSRRWKHVSNVCRINLSSNLISVLPNAISDHALLSSKDKRQLREYAVDVLTELDLANNSITDIAFNAFHSIDRLTNLDLSQNRITVFNVNANDLIYLKYLNLSTNYITLLHLTSLSSMFNLQNLDLSNNSLDKIPEYTFENSYYLTSVNMTHNHISNVQTLRIKMFHPKGGVLDLSNNGLSELNIPEGQGLSNLILHSNNITDPSRIKLNHRHSELQYLDLSKNLILGLNQSLLLPNTLSLLDLSFNNISFVKPGVFGQFNKLKTLRISHNHLRILEYGIFQGLSSLENLDLSFNDIYFIDSKVFIDLKFLALLSLKYNMIYYMDYNAWLGHKCEVRVNIEGNNITCQWLGIALNDYNNGISKMKLSALQSNPSQNSLGGIPCVDETREYIDGSSDSLYDEKLLITSQKILEAVKEQTSYLRIIMSHNMDYSPKTYPVRNFTDDKK